MLYVDSTVDENGNGSEMSPFSSISVAVDNAGNNSHVILKKGIYKGSSNTGIVIDKDLTIESFDGGVTIDGENKNAFFKINSVWLKISIKWFKGFDGFRINYKKN